MTDLRGVVNPAQPYLKILQSSSSSAWSSKSPPKYHKTVNLSTYRKMRIEKLVIHRQINSGDRL
ncbi:MAG: hypothetical protein F6K39_34280 [Okeania sp. SIO3B3]|nr:hypothetical protein [Okeania sp. SIO3B3]